MLFNINALYQKQASLPKRTIKEVSLVYDSSRSCDDITRMGMMIAYHDPDPKKKYITKTVTPRGAYIDKLIDLSEKNELFG